MPLLQIKSYHAIADVEHSGGPREDAGAGETVEEGKEEDDMWVQGQKWSFTSLLN